MIFDFHTHCYPNLLAPKAMAVIPKYSPFAPHYDGTLKGLKSSMKKNGINFSLTLHHAPNANAVKKVNDWAIECQKTQGVFAFGSVHPDFKNIEEELVRLKQNGIKGLKFHPYYQNFELNDKKMYKIFEKAASHDMIMLFHCGIDLLIKGCKGSAGELGQLAHDLKGAKIVGAHLGGCGMWQQSLDLLLGKEIYLDTSFAFRYLSRRQRQQLIEGHNHSYLLFGSDAPWVDPSIDVALIKQHFCPQSAQNILFNNAATLLGIHPKNPV